MKTVENPVIASKTIGGGGSKSLTNLRFKHSFTLAEVLITLGIIGIVAAMTLPALITNYQKKVSATRLEQTYSMLSQAFLLAQKDHEDIQYWNFGGGQDATNGGNFKTATTTFTETYLLPYLKGATSLGFMTLSQAGYKKSFTALNGNSLTNGNLTLADMNYLIDLPNGVTLFLRCNNNSSVTISQIVIYADINSKAKPNMFGRDAFAFTIDATGFKFFGQEYNRTILLRDSCKKSTEWGNIRCGALIMKDGWEIKDDYPW